MLELDITHMVKDSGGMAYLSGNVLEHGLNAGAITWNNSKEYANEHPLLKDNQIQAAKDYFKEFGAWSDEERAAWTNEEVQGLVVQYIAGDIREMEMYDTFEEYEKASAEGQVSGNIFKSGDKYYFSLHH